VPDTFTQPRIPNEIFRSSSLKGTSWMQAEIPVCWENMTPELAQGRAWVEDAVEKSWDTAANIDFIGWQACQEDSDGIRIVVKEAGPRVEDLGRLLDGLPNGMVLNFTFASWGTDCALTEELREFCIRALAVHEFGHALGLTHEDLRNDSNVKREECFAEAQGPNPSFHITDYDPKSVMNYCAADWNNNGRLTPLDVAGVRLIYGPFDDQTPAALNTEVQIAFDASSTELSAPETYTYEGLKLTATNPENNIDESFCKNNRLIEIKLTSKLIPDSTQISVTGKVDLYAASADCNSKGALLVEGLVDYSLFEAGVAGGASLMLTPADSNLQPAFINMTSARTLGGDEATSETCTNCVAVSAAAVFATRPETSTPPVTSADEAQKLSNWQRLATPSPLVVATNGGPWFSPDISVCWENTNTLHTEARAWTQTAVRQTWEKVSAVKFIGWETCTQADNQSIHIRVADTGPNVAETGRNLAGLPGGMTLNFTFANWGQGCADYLEYCIKALAVHEFGHALGLAHEHNRGDRPSACDTEPQGPLPSYIITEYDPSSVMNYCSEDWNNNGKLSPLDVFGIRSLYGPFTEDFPLQVAHYGAIRFTPADGTDPIAHDISFDVALSDVTPVAKRAFSICNGDDLLVEVTSTTSLDEGRLSPSVENQTRIYQTRNCAPGGTLIDEHKTAGNMPVPGDSIGSFASDIFEIDEATGTLGRGVGGSLSPRRTLGRDVTAETCESCVAASQEARFGPQTPPISLSSAKLHTASTATATGAASPWPSDFKLDLEVCAREVKSGPNFGGVPWSPANIAQLCKPAPTSKAPAQCFAKIMTEGLDYGGGRNWAPENALSLCAGSDDSDATITCFRNRIATGDAWSAAIAACAAP
jgi:predicted Zn-dependent protease with MMP-like domain